jgi:predicted negative regulator of RcsB-dependent stress response
MAPKPHPSSRRKQEEPKEAEDAFVEKILEISNWAKANSQILLLAGIVLVVIVAGTVYYNNYRASVQEQAVIQLENVRTSIGAGDREATKNEYYRYLDRFDGTVYGLEARLMLGQLLLEDDDFDRAIDVLAPAVREMDNQPIGIQAGFLMAAAYEESGRNEDAVRMLLRIANTTDLNFQVQEALGGAARLRASEGDFRGAAELYEEVLSSLEEDDPLRAYWELRLAEASARG